MSKQTVSLLFFRQYFSCENENMRSKFFLLVQKKQTKQNAKQEKGQAVKNWSTEAPKRMSRRRRQKKNESQVCDARSMLLSPE